MITQNTYKDYLHKLKDKMYATLCLYEEEVDTFSQYFDSFLNVELKGLKYTIEDLPHDLWYVETIARLKSIERICKEDEGKFSHEKTVRSELFGIMSLIDKQIKQLERK